MLDTVVGAVDGDGDVTDLQDPGAGGEFEHLMERVGEQVFVFAAELADGIVVGMGVGSEETHRHVFVSESFDASAGEGARRVAVNQQPQHHGGWVLGVTGAALVGARTAQIQSFDRIHDEVHHVIRGHPVAQVGRQQQRGVVVNVDETGGHALDTPNPPKLFREFEF